jgi:hypothetical protein
MIYEYIVIGCGVSGIMASSMIKERTDNFKIIERQNDLGGIWRSEFSKNQTHLQHNSSMYLLDSFFRVSNETNPKEIPNYADKNTVIKVLNKFVRDKNLHSKIQFNTSMIDFTEIIDKNLIEIKCIYGNCKFKLKCKYLFICTGNLSVPKLLNNSIDNINNNIINYIEINDYETFFKNKKSIIVIGAGSSGVEVCINAIKYGLKDITLVYNEHLGFYFNNYFNEFLFTIIHILPKIIANDIYIMIQHMIALIKGYQLPKYIGTADNTYPFSTKIIQAFNDKKIKIIKNSNALDLSNVNKTVIVTIGFDNSLKQFGIKNNELYNLNTRHHKYKNVFFVGFNKNNTGTTTYSNYLMLSGIFHIIDNKLQCIKSSIDDTLYTPLLYFNYLISIGTGINPFLNILKFWLQSLWLHYSTIIIRIIFVFVLYIIFCIW